MALPYRDQFRAVENPFSYGEYVLFSTVGILETAKPRLSTSAVPRRSKSTLRAMALVFCATSSAPVSTPKRLRRKIADSFSRGLGAGRAASSPAPPLEFPLALPGVMAGSRRYCARLLIKVAPARAAKAIKQYRPTPTARRTTLVGHMTKG